jgi:hypothetical protein
MHWSSINEVSLRSINFECVFLRANSSCSVSTRSICGQLWTSGERLNVVAGRCRQVAAARGRSSLSALALG